MAANNKYCSPLRVAFLRNLRCSCKLSTEKNNYFLSSQCWLYLVVPSRLDSFFFCWLQMSLKMTKKSAMKFLPLRYTFSLVYTFWRLLQLNLIFRCNTTQLCSSILNLKCYKLLFKLHCQQCQFRLSTICWSRLVLATHSNNNTNENLNGKIFYLPTKRCIFAFCHIVGG